MFSELAPFERDPVTVLVEERSHTIARRQLEQRVNAGIEQRGLHKLESDYLDMSTFYYDRVTKMIWEVEWSQPNHLAAPFRKPSREVFMHIAALNRLTGLEGAYATQQQTL